MKAKVDVVNTNRKPAKVWKVFAILGFVMSIIGLSISYLPFMTGLYLSIPGMVFSILGRKSEKLHKLGNAGFVVSIIGLALAVISTIVFLIIILPLILDGSQSIVEALLGLLQTK